jgi:hypothetical protein
LTEVSSAVPVGITESNSEVVGATGPKWEGLTDPDA